MIPKKYQLSKISTSNIQSKDVLKSSQGRHSSLSYFICIYGLFNVAINN